VTEDRRLPTVDSRYRLDREIGSGGMATVYLAYDTKHDRQVALKVVKPEVVASVGADRFIAEIRTTAHLKHPHILPLFDSGTAGDTLFYVMPYIEGESLRARLAREGPLPVGEAVRILREVADALAYAHAQGIVHRDIKPDNVLLSGRHVFLADFGIAKALQTHAPADQTVAATSVVLGTPAYMPPEQIAGHGSIDHRADIFAFGAMAYEMLAGSPPTVAAQPLSKIRPAIPPVLASLVTRCLERNPDDRWQRVDDLITGLEAVSIAAGADIDRALQRRRDARRIRGGLAALTIAAALAIVWLMTRTPPTVLSVGRMTKVTREPGLEIDPALSPDGTRLAYVAGPPGARRLYVRQVDGGPPIALTTEATGGVQRRPDWSPDGTRLAFQAGRQGFGVRSAARAGTLYVIQALGGPPRRLVSSVREGVAMSPAWSPDGSQIAFGGWDGLYVVPATGGQPALLTGEENLPHSIQWSPDGARIAFVNGAVGFTLSEELFGNTDNSSIQVLTMASGKVEAVTSGDWLDVSPVWMPDSRGLLFVSNRGGGRDVFRMRLGRSGRPDGEPERITSGLNAHSISLSKDGRLLAYSSYTSRANIWSLAITPDRIATAADAERVTSGSEKTEKLVISPDGQWLAYDSDRAGSADVWKVRVGGGEPEQVTRSPANEFANDWSPDGQEIFFHTIRGETRRDVMVAAADGTRIDTVVATGDEEQHASLSPDGNSLAYSRGQSGERYDVYVTTRASKGAPWGTPRRLTTSSGIDPKWSPDGGLIAYTRQGEVHLLSPDGAGDRVLVHRSPVAGAPQAQYAIWSPDGQTVFYKAHDDERRATIWSVPVGGGTPRLLARLDDPLRPALRREFATDGKRLYFMLSEEESDISVIELVGK
jgi:serine/threonine-protein kinase